MATYNFSVPSFHIAEVRSAHSDTLFASTALIVMNANGSLHHDFGAQGAALGDRKAGGGVDLNLRWENIDVPDPTPENPDGGAVYWTFLLVNAGHGDSGFVAVLNKAADAFAGALAGKVLDPGEAGVSSLMFLAGLGVILAAQEVLNLFTADCDGQVASGDFKLTAAQLRAMANNPSGLALETTQNNPGVRSPAGCGSNSSYDITYKIVESSRLTIAYVADNPTNDLLVISSEDGVRWSGNIQTGHQSKTAPDLCGRT
jgi:hypothetical protein